MSDYTKATNFTLKDGLTSGDPGKVIKGSEIDDEFDLIASAVASKANINSPTFTGTPTLPSGTVATTVADSADSSTKVATTAFVQSVLSALYPVGSIYSNATNATNPGTLLGFGTWTAFGAGRVPVGYDGTNTNFNASEKTGGSADAIVVSHSHTSGTLATDSAGNHQHTYTYRGNTAGGTGGFSFWENTSTANTGAAGAHTHTLSGSTATEGSSGTDANLQPYITVYMWKRTA